MTIFWWVNKNERRRVNISENNSVGRTTQLTLARALSPLFITVFASPSSNLTNQGSMWVERTSSPKKLMEQIFYCLKKIEKARTPTKKWIKKSILFPSQSICRQNHSIQSKKQLYPEPDTAKLTFPCTCHPINILKEKTIRKNIDHSSIQGIQKKRQVIENFESVIHQACLVSGSLANPKLKYNNKKIIEKYIFNHQFTIQ